LQRTTRDEPDYDKLMEFRLKILDAHNLKLDDIQKVIAGISPLPGAKEFVQSLCEKTQLIILSDTFEQFASPLMKQLNYPTLFCKTLKVDPSGKITGWELRQKNGKKFAVEAFKGCNIKVFAAGDSFNDLAMIKIADDGALINAPQPIKDANPDIPSVETYQALESLIDEFLQ